MKKRWIVFLLAILLLINISLADLTDVVKNKTNEFEKLSDKEKTKAIYSECLTSRILLDTGKLDVHGTEYYIGEIGKVWVQLLNSQKQYISNGTCLVSIYYPDGSVYERDAYMLYLDKGIYYNDIVIPEITGVYPVVVECFYLTTQFLYSATSGAINVGTNVAGDYTRTQVDDGVKWEVQESGGRIDVGLNFTGLTQPLGFSNMVWIWNGDWKAEKGDVANDYITIQVWNFTSNSWYSLNNRIYYSDAEQTITNTISATNLTLLGLVQGGTMRIRMIDTALADGKATKLKTDYFSVRLVGLTGGEYQEVKGSGEIHVSDIPRYVWEYDNRTLTYYPDGMNYTYFNEKFSELNESLGKINLNISFNSTELENLILQLNQTLFEMNQSNYDNFYYINQKLNDVNEKLIQILNNQTSFSNLLYYHNQTVMSYLLQLKNRIDNVYSLLESHDENVLDEIQSIQEDLGEISGSVYQLQNMLDDNTTTIIDEIRKLGLNVTNITVEIVGNMTDLPRATYMYSQLVEERLLSNHDYCINETTKIKELLIEKCLNDDCWNITKTETFVCPYGCSEGQCNPSPTRANVTILIIIGVVMTALAGIYYVYVRWA